MNAVAFVAASLLLIGQEAGQGGLPAGTGKVVVEAGGKPIDVYTYVPKAYKDGPLILVLHGTLRNAAEYRDDARAMADRLGAIVAAPEFDSKRFPNAKYHRGGLIRADGSVAQSDEWTWSLVRPLADGVRKRLGKPGLPFYLIGHSAGGQFVGRMAAFVDSGAERVVVANPSAYVFPTLDRDFPYGLGGLGEGLSNEDQLRAYLARPVTIYLGTADDERDGDLDKSAEADRQGRTRLRRGRATFAAAEQLARDKGWPFRWRLVEAPGVGHDHQKMFDAPECATALFGRPSSPSRASATDSGE